MKQFELVFQSQEIFRLFQQKVKDYKDSEQGRPSTHQAILEMVVNHNQNKKDLTELRSEYTLLMQSHSDLSQRYDRMYNRLKELLQDTPKRA